MLLLFFFTTKSTRGFQLRCESVSMPRYLMQYSLFNCLLFKKRLKEKSCNPSRGGWKIMKFDFSIFRESWLALSQVWTLINSEFILFCSIWRLLLSSNKFASSAKKWKSNSCEEQWKSFIYNKNNKGPRTEPCGIPHVILLSNHSAVKRKQNNF